MKSLILSTCAALVLQLSPASAVEHAEAMMRATFKLFNKDSTATCFLLRDGAEVYLVTAAHTFERASGETSILVLREVDQDGVWKRQDKTISIRKGDQALWTKHPKQDLAVMRVKLDLPEGASLPLDVVKSEGFPAFGDPVMLLTYPARVEANGAGFPLARQAVVGSFPAEPMAKHPEFIIDATAWDGDSGGPVFIDAGGGKPQVVGLVISRINHVENIKSERETRKIETPMGLSKALAAPLIFETIRLAKEAAADR
ncbi:serine protease [Luteolibacter flavescens]|uniref:Serine protease n=1 Tax=Luteolibacter flavescens TaxID=1859460 RepID=A0ABT3FUT8_9BACT|nr:serine protease [Luteolibacter flavescens]MCW1886969.1 serine protease [Luteolibacter flavescens]